MTFFLYAISNTLWHKPHISENLTQIRKRWILSARKYSNYMLKHFNMIFIQNDTENTDTWNTKNPKHHNLTDFYLIRKVRWYKSTDRRHKIISMSSSAIHLYHYAAQHFLKTMTSVMWQWANCDVPMGKLWCNNGQTVM